MPKPRRKSAMTEGSTRRYLVYLLRNAPFMPFRYFL